MTAATWRSAFVAIAFAIHPLHVESVAWVAERKDLLSGFFFMLTIIAYIRYAERPTIAKYLPVVLFLSLGLMSKPMLVTLPFVLLLLDYWPLQRLQWKDTGQSSAEGEPVTNQRENSAWKLAAEKIPLFILAACSSAITIIIQRGAGAMKTLERYPLDIRICNAIVSYLGYIIKMFHPARLAILYPLQPYNIPKWQPIVSLLALIIITAAIYAARRRRYLPVGWLWYVGMLIPVIGIVHVGSQAMADRYTYLPSIGIFIIVAWGAAELATKVPLRRIVLTILGATVVTTMLICTRLQLRHWRNNFTVYEHALAVTEENFIILYNYGHSLCNSGRFEEGIVQLQKALRLCPREPDAYNSLGSALKEMGKTKEAIESWRKALALDPNYKLAHFQLGLTLSQQGNYEEAVYHFQEALRVEPNWPDAYYHLGGAYLLQGKLDLAALQCAEAVRLNPDYLAAQVTLAHLLIELGQIQKAMEVVKTASKLAAETGKEDPAPTIMKHLQQYKDAHP
jgi:Tfp pilus assembly protein PilF